MSPLYVDLFHELSTYGSESCVVTIIVVSSVVGVACNSFYPSGLSDLTSPLTTKIAGRTDCADRAVTIMWSTVDDIAATGHVNINHFVPLFPRRHENYENYNRSSTGMVVISNATVMRP